MNQDTFNRIKFHSVNDLTEWLVMANQVDHDIIGNAAEVLFQAGFRTPTSLMGIPGDCLKRAGLSDPISRYLNNKLEKKIQQSQQPIFVCQVVVKDALYCHGARGNIFTKFF